MPQLTLEQALQLALTHHNAGRLPEAEAVYRQILAQQPHHPEALHLLGVLAGQTGHLTDAITLIRQAIALNPGNAVYHSNLGNFLHSQAHIDEAITSYQQALLLNPNYIEAHINLGTAWKDKQQLDQAIVCFQKALAIDPHLAPAYSNLGAAQLEKSQFNEAVASLRQALALNPNYAEAHNNLGNALKDHGQLDSAIASYRQAVTLNPALVDAHDNLLLTLHYHPAIEPQAIAEEHFRWNLQHAQSLQTFVIPHHNAYDPHRPLRIGYVSPDFRNHPVARFLLPLLKAHDRNAFQIFCYSNTPAPDAMTEKLKSHTHTWRNILGLSDDQAADLIRQDQIDLLIDLAGHTAGNRLLLFARKPAPIQLTWLGYPNTTGLTAIDYRLVDPHTDPPTTTDHLHSEKLLRLPQTFLRFGPPEDTPPVNPPPAISTGHITFGSFNALSKINDPLLALWSQILHQIPISHLLLKNESTHFLPTRERRLLNFFTNTGVSPGRIHFLPQTPSYAAHMQLYHQIDIALDTYPYHGTATSFDALWMGVPIISLAGKSHVSRVAVSILKNLALPELLAHTPEQYIQIAIELANDLSCLTQLRSTLRDRLQNSPLMDAPSFARNIEKLYRSIWQTRCNNYSTTL